MPMTRSLVQLAVAPPGGWPRSMILVPAPDRGLLVHSPTWLGDDTFARVEAHGEPRVLFAPNHFHYLSIARFRERYPRAKVVAGTTALTRLRAKGRLDVEHVDAARAELSPGTSFLECAGTRAGETLLSVDDAGTRTWIACDAFFNVATPVDGALGVLLRALKTTPGLCLGQTFLWLALRDRRAYREWILEALAREKPTRLYVSHGEVAEGGDLAERLAALVRARV
jgi:hypothetical protein